MIDQEITFGAAIGYSSGKNSSSLKTPPVQQIRSYFRWSIIRFHKINIKLLAICIYLSTYNLHLLIYIQHIQDNVHGTQEMVDNIKGIV